MIQFIRKNHHTRFHHPSEAARHGERRRDCFCSSVKKAPPRGHARPWFTSLRSTSEAVRQAVETCHPVIFG